MKISQKIPNSYICRSFPSLSNLAPTKASFYLHRAPFQAAKMQCFFCFSLTKMPCWEFFALLLFFFIAFEKPQRFALHAPNWWKTSYTFQKTLQKLRPTYQWLVVTWMCFTLVGFGPGLLIQFGLTLRQTLPFFPTTQGCCTRGHPCLFAEINLFPWKSKSNTFLFWQHRSVSLASGMAMLKRLALKIVIIFCLFGFHCYKLPGMQDMAKRLSVSLFLCCLHTDNFFLGHGTDNYHVCGPVWNWRLRLPKRGLEKQNQSCTAPWNLAYSLPKPSRAPLGLCACGFTSISATFVKNFWSTVCPVMSNFGTLCKNLFHKN